MSNCSRWERGDKRKEDRQPTHTKIASLSATIYSTTTNYALSHLCHHSITYTLHPVPNSNATFPYSSTLQNSSNHSLAHTILHTSSNCIADLNQIPHNPRNEVYPPLLCCHTLHTSRPKPFPSYPPTTQLNQSSAWTTTLHYPDTVVTSHTYLTLCHLFSTYTFSICFSYILLHPSSSHFLP